MHEPIDQVKRILRAERCPGRVRSQVQLAMARDRASMVSHGRRRLVGFAAVVLVFLALGMARWFPGGSPVPELPPKPDLRLTRAQVLDEAHLSLSCIGSVFIEAGQRTETILINHLNPRLFAGLERAANAISKPNQP